MTKSFLIIVTAFVMWAKSAVGGTLDDAPFRVVLPKDGWVVDDAKVKDMGSKVYQLASLTHTNSGTTVMVFKTQVKPSKGSLGDFSEGFRDSLSKPTITNITERGTIFVNCKARLFSYERKHEGQLIYNDAMLFVVNDTAWSILCVDYEKDGWKLAQKLFESRVDGKTP